MNRSRRCPYRAWLQDGNENVPRERHVGVEVIQMAIGKIIPLCPQNCQKWTANKVLITEDLSSMNPQSPLMKKTSCLQMNLSHQSDTQAEDGDAPVHRNITSKPLFVGSAITNIEACHLAFTLFMKVALTRERLGTILLMFCRLLPSPNTLPPTPYKFFKFLAKFRQGPGPRTHSY